MSRLSKIVFSFFVSVIMLSFMGGCQTEKVKTDKLKVAVSVLPYKGLVEAIGGDRVEVVSLLPPGVSPPEFDPTPALLQKAGEADLYIRVGEFFEFENVWLEKLKDITGNTKVFDSGANLEIEHHNPHVWHGVKEVKEICKNICKTLCENDSLNADVYENNLQNYLFEIDKIEKVVEEMLSNIKNRIMFTYHPAWLYFGKSFNIELVSIEDHGKAPKAKDIARLIDLAKKTNAKAIFVEPQFESNTARTIANEINAELIELDPLPSDYLESMMNLALKMEKYLK